jgi:hypothetical protein
MIRICVITIFITSFFLYSNTVLSHMAHITVGVTSDPVATWWTPQARPSTNVVAQRTNRDISRVHGQPSESNRVVEHGAHYS